MKMASQVDVVILDFEKAFDTVAHQRLLRKLLYYGITGDVHHWIANWLIGRGQCVIVDGEKSATQSVESGVPQGTVLGPILFLVYINDIAEEVQADARLFADDGLLFRVIESVDDAQALQSDINKVALWSKKWQMRFNATKCYIMRITRKHHPIIFHYSMHGHILKVKDHHPYLGIELDNTLSWNDHIKKTTAKAHKTLNFLRRNLYRCPTNVKEAAYKTMVRPTLEYACSAWDPGDVGQIKALEKVQRKAARFVTSDWSYCTSVTDLMKSLEWQSLQERRIIRRLVLFYQAKHRLFAIHMPPYVQPPPRLPARRHDQQFNPITCHTNSYMDSFWPRTISSWNYLPAHIVESTTPATLKASLTRAFNTGELRLAPSRDPLARITGAECAGTILF